MIQTLVGSSSLCQALQVQHFTFNWDTIAVGVARILVQVEHLAEVVLFSGRHGREFSLKGHSMPIMPIGIRGFTLTAQAPILSNFDLQDSQHLSIIKEMIKRFWGGTTQPNQPGFGFLLLTIVGIERGLLLKFIHFLPGGAQPRRKAS